MEKGDACMTKEHVNSVELVGALHFVKGKQHDENRGGRYYRFSLRQDSVDVRGNARCDYIVVRAFDEELKNWIQEQQEGTLIRLTGEIRSSVGSGAMYVLADTLELVQ
jgi:hypothetical protein